jgi:DsbC/DsbD-like thiol-disulfide interchange protein
VIFRATIAMIALATSVAADDWTSKRPEHVRVEPVQAVVVRPGGTATAEVRFRVVDGFHINSSKPTSELLIPTVLTVNGSKELKVGKVVYPPGHDFALKFSPNEKLNVYSGEVSLKVPVTALRRANSASHKLTGALRYQACDDSSCFPPRTMTFEIPVQVR